MYNTVKSPSKGNKCHAARGVYKKLSIFHRPKWWWIKQMWSDYLEVYPRQGCVQSCMKSWQKGEVIVPFKSKLYFGTKIDCPLLRRVVVKTFNTALLENAFIFCCLMYFGTSYLSIVIYKLVVYTIMINVSCTLNDVLFTKYCYIFSTISCFLWKIAASASFNIFRIMIGH